MSAETRRASRVAALVAAVAAATAFAWAPAASYRPPALTLGAGPHLLIDDAVIESSTHLRPVVQRPRRSAAPAVTKEQAPNGWVAAPSLIYDRERDVLRMWHWVRSAQRGSELVYRESADGLSWPGPGETVFRYVGNGTAVVDDGPRAADPSRRFKLAYFRDDPAPMGMSLAFSPDGRRWSLHEGNPVRPYFGPDDPRFVRSTGDIVDPFWDPIRRRYGALVKMYTSSEEEFGLQGRLFPKGRGIRLTGITYSDDFVRWDDPRRTFVPDRQDQGVTEFYGGPVLARGPLLIAFLRILRDDLPADSGGEVEGIGYTVIASSRDGVTWSRYREPFLDRAPAPGAFDHAMAWITGVAEKDGQVFLGYSALNQGHKVGDRQIGMATIARDRFVARETVGDAAGALQTRPILVAAGVLRGLWINADATGGEVRTQVRNAEGRVVEGFRFDECNPLRADSAQARISCRRDFTVLDGSTFRLEFSLRNARLYGFAFKEGL